MKNVAEATTKEKTSMVENAEAQAQEAERAQAQADKQKVEQKSSWGRPSSG